jgi:hypothetical protein
MWAYIPREMPQEEIRNKMAHTSNLLQFLFLPALQKMDYSNA